MMMALSFCPVDKVILYFEQLGETLIDVYGDTEAHEKFIRYMRKTWIGTDEKPALFNRAIWNNREITITDLPRTTNSIESWHKNISAYFNAPHPNIYTLINGMLLENVRVFAICAKLEAGQELPLYPKKKYQEHNQKLIDLIGTYNEDNPVQFLQNCAGYINY
ncbi:hypothetical protein DdX_07358 [Ditylenchus destructor]|uniref:MULE transposase domain-containing protein n=1 Tax=Ditylenchus destructor TaxID=166010 RepID=A0AAD4N4F9_9BILA|nr:hypothetical protein DdX_07358 [Ditylenchus destructor]